MKLPRISRRHALRLLILVPTIPVALWAGVLLMVPTDWARARLVGELEGLTGGKVTIGSIHLGPLGNLRIRGVAVAEAATADDPWLKVGEARLDVHLIQMLTGCCRPTDIALAGVDLRIHRRADGTLEFAALLGGEPKASAESRSGGSSPRVSVSLTLSASRVVVLDDPSATRVEITEGSGTATWDGGRAVIETVRGKLNGGSVEFAARYDGDAPAPRFEAELRAHGVRLGGLEALGLLVPVVSDVADSLDGLVNLTLALKGRGDSLLAIRPTLEGYGSIRLNPIDLGASKLLDAVEGLRSIPRSSRVGSVESHFAIGGGRVATDDLTVTIARMPIRFAGWTDFDGRIDYRVKSEQLRELLAAKLPAEARQILGGLKDDLVDLASLRITGTIDAPTVSAGPSASGALPAFKDDERARVREAARKLRDKYLR